MRTPPDLTDPFDPAVVEALTRRCEQCKAAAGTGCSCGLHGIIHTLALCPTSNGRIVHYSRAQTRPRGGQ